MSRALFLAQKGRFSTSPNPRVGAVIVRNSNIIGEGFHQQYGEAHAEVNAVNAVADQSILSEAEIFVTLEPCSHFGKTPPCVDLLLKHKFNRVIIATQDPFTKVDGSGIAKLQKAGIEVTLDCMKAEAQAINKRFFTFHQKKRPYIILKWAQTSDHFISRFPKDISEGNNWITQAVSKQLVHQWRAEEDAILVGKNTVLVDNPQLTCRAIKGKNPIRFVIDENLELPKHCKVFNNEAKTIVLNAKVDKVDGNINFIKGDLRTKLTQLLVDVCNEQQIQSIIIEGGATTLQQFIKEQLWDEARVFTGNKKFKTGIVAPTIQGTISSKHSIEEDELIIYNNN